MKRFVLVIFIIHIYTNIFAGSIFDAIDSTNINNLKILCKNKSELNKHNSDGETPLTYIVKNKIPLKNKKEMIGILLKSGANPKLFNSEGLTVLHVSSRYDCYDKFELTEYIIKQGVNVNILDKYGQTILFDLLTIESQPEEQLKYFIDFFVSHGGNLNIIDDEGYSVLLSMISKVLSDEESGYLAHDFSTEIEYLIKKGAKVNIRTKKGESGISISKKTNANKHQILILMKYGEVE
jgi:ankyrin repeat protein